MKAIAHPAPQLQNYNKVLQFLDLPISFCFSVQNLWITALMIAYETPNQIDAFIWILPNIIAILIRPFLIRYVHKSFSVRQAQLALISHFLLGGVLGCFLVSISSQYFQEFYRIIICIVGWTIMDICFQMAAFFGEKTKQRLKNLGYQKTDNYNYSFIGQILGYLLSFVLCLLKGGKVIKKFYVCSSYIYLTSTVVAGGYWILLYFSSYDSLNLRSQQPQNQSITLRKDIAFYLPGYYELIRSNGFDRWLLTMHFTFLYIVDILLIYGSMWIIMVYQQLGQKQGISYYGGMKEGSLVLLTFILFSYANLFKFFIKNTLQTKKLLKYFIGLLIMICVVGTLLFVDTNHYCIFGLAALIGTAHGLYNNQIVPSLTNTNQIYDACQQLVDRIQKFVVLCIMPFIVMIVLERDDISDCLLSLPIVVTILLILSFIYKQSQELQIKQKKINKKQ